MSNAVKTELLRIAAAINSAAEHLQAYVAANLPDDPTTPTPTPTTPTPTPTDPADAITVPPGKFPAFVAGMTYALVAGGQYTPADLTADGVTILGNGATLNIANGKQWKVPGSKNLVRNLKTSKGGLGKDNQNAAILVKGDGNRFLECEIADADYVGITFDGDDCEFTGKLLRCGMAGTGGKGDRLNVHDFLADGNNHRKQRDGATLGKFTRTKSTHIHHGKCVNGYFADIWFDINNADFLCEDLELVGCQKTREDYEGVGIKTEIGGRKGTIRRVKVYGQNGPAVVVNECREITVTDNDLGNGKGPNRAVLHVRNDRRPDENSRATEPAAPGDWQVKDLTFTGNRLLDEQGNPLATGEGFVTGSGATDDPLDFAADNIVIEPNAFTVKVKAWK